MNQKENTISTNQTSQNTTDENSKNNEDLIDDLDVGEDEDFEISNYGGGNAEDDLFDNIVGSLQDLVLEEDFEVLQRVFLDENCEIFEETEENKMEYWEVFKAYQKKIEQFLEMKLKERIPDLNMKKFFDMITTRAEEIDSQLLDTLLCFTDFPQFKELMLDHLRFKKKAAKSKPKKGKAPNDEKKTSLTSVDKPKEKQENLQPSLDDQFSDLLICTPARSVLGTNKKKEKTKTSDENIFSVKADTKSQPFGINPTKKETN